MADTKRHNLKVVSEEDKRENRKKRREHRQRVLKRTIIASLVVLLCVGGTAIYMALRQYGEYDVRASVERADTKATVFKEFQGNILKYSNDGAMYTDHSNELIWNQTYEMSHPTVDMCGNYVAIYDQKGKNAYVLNKKGLVHGFETNLPIIQISVASQGTIAVLQDNGSTGILTIYDKEGNELVNGAIHGEKGGFPIAIALSDDAIKLGVSMLDISSGTVKTTLAFYNFGSIGENEIDHMVSVTTYDDLVIPELDFVSSDCMIALGDSKVMVFEGTQKPKQVSEILLVDEAKSVFYNENYVGVVYNSNDELIRHQMQVYDFAGKLRMETAFDTEYESVELLSSNEVCILNDTSCDIYTIQGVYKFHHEFEEELYYVVPGGSSLNYTFLLNNVTVQARLK